MSDKPRLISTSEVSKHSSATDCWLVIDNEIWDFTDFAPSHPGGPGIITRHAGRDATESFSSIHDQSILRENLDRSKFIGHLDRSTINTAWLKPPPSENPQAKLNSTKPPLSILINAHDFEVVASSTATPKTWAFYSSAATDLTTHRANSSLLNRIWFRPRVLRNVTQVSTRTTILRHVLSSPLMVSPAAMAKLIHPDGELALASACASRGILQCISTNASYPVPAIVDPHPRHPFIFQLYVNRDRAKSADILRMLNSKPNIAAIMLTVDAATAGKREADERVKADENLSVPLHSDAPKNDNKGGGYARVMGGFIDPALCWDDVAWLRSQTSLPIILKGVMTATDAKKALEYGLDGIMVSNHGGRNLDTSPPSVLVMLELHRLCPEVFERMTVMVDGGIRRGTDILKCVCLGARGVGVGRSFLYATGYGRDGVEKLIDILHDELEVAMKLCGITDLSQATPALLNTADIDHLVPGKMDRHPWITWNSYSFREANTLKPRL